jgi:hypothetical protein
MGRPICRSAVCAQPQGASLAKANFLERSEVIEGCYEFMLAYAAQGLPDDQGRQAGKFASSWAAWPKR